MDSSQFQADARAGSYGSILRMAIPLVFSMAGQTVMQFLDGIFLSRYSEYAIAAAGPAGMTCWILTSLFIGAAGYTSTFIAQYKGAGKPEKIGASVWQGIYFGLATGILIALTGVWSGEKIFSFAGHDPRIIPLEADFFTISCLAAPFTVTASALSGFFSGRGDMKRLMAVQMSGQILNGLLAFCMIFGKFGFPEMGIAGAAWAVWLAQGFVCVTLLLYMWHLDAQGRFGVRTGTAFNRAMFARLFRYGMPNGFRFFFEMSAWAAFLLFVGRIGERELAATNISWRINMFAFFPMIGLSIAVATIVGQMQGARRPDISAACTWRGLALTQIWMILFACLFVCAPAPIVRLFSGSGALSSGMEEIVRTTIILLRYVAVYCLLDGVNMVTVGALQGAGDTKWTMLISVVMHSLFIGVLFILDRLHAGLHVFWTAATVFVMLIALIWLLRFVSGRWRTMRVIEPDPPAPA